MHFPEFWGSGLPWNVFPETFHLRNWADQLDCALLNRTNSISATKILIYEFSSDKQWAQWLQRGELSCKTDAEKAIFTLMNNFPIYNRLLREFNNDMWYGFTKTKQYWNATICALGHKHVTDLSTLCWTQYYRGNVKFKYTCKINALTKKQLVSVRWNSHCHDRIMFNP